MAGGFPVNSTGREAISHLCRLDVSVLERLLQVKWLSGDLSLSASEKSRLLSLLGLPSMLQVERVVSFCFYVMEQSRTMGLSPTALKNFLVRECGMESSHAQAFEKARQLQLANKNKSTGEDDKVASFWPRLETVDSEVAIVTEERDSGERSVCFATLLLTDHSHDCTAVEFTFDELKTFFFQIEDIQAQIDAYFP